MKKENLEQMIFVDNDPELNLEFNSFSRQIFDFIFIPILNSLPKNFKHIIKKTNNSASVVIDNATNHQALEVLYSKGELFSLKKIGNSFYNVTWWKLFTFQRKVVITILPKMLPNEIMSTDRPTVADFRAGGQKVLDRISNVMNTSK